MSTITGPDFIGLQIEDLNAAKAFYGDVLGMKVQAERPDAVIFASQPIPFACRTPLEDLSDAKKRGQGVALWFACADADALHDELSAQNVPIAFKPKDGPFGRYFAFVDPFGYTITAHTTSH